MALSSWHTTAADNASAGTINWAEGMSPAVVNDSARQTMADVRTWYEDAEWRDLGHSPTYASASSFTISSAASLSSIYCVNRRLRITDSVTGTSYGTISATTWVGATQTVTLSPLSTVLNTTTAVSIGVSPTNSSIPASSLDGLTAFAIAQAVLTTPGDMIYASSTATAARLAVGATTSILVTGSSGLPTWTASPTLSSATFGNATDKGAGTINVASGIYDNGTQISAASYGTSLILISTATPGATATVQFTALGTTYDEFEIHCIGIKTVSNSVTLNLNFGTGATPTWDTSANYAYMLNGILSAASTPAAATSSGDAVTAIILNFSGANGFRATAPDSFYGRIRLASLPSSSLTKRLTWDFEYYTQGSNHAGGQGYGYWGVTTAATAVQIQVSSGNYSGGTFYLYGVKKQ